MAPASASSSAAQTRCGAHHRAVIENKLGGGAQLMAAARLAALCIIGASLYISAYLRHHAARNAAHRANAVEGASRRGASINRTCHCEEESLGLVPASRVYGLRRASGVRCARITIGLTASAIFAKKARKTYAKKAYKSASVIVARRLRISRICGGASCGIGWLHRRIVRNRHRLLKQLGVVCRLALAALRNHRRRRRSIAWPSRRRRRHRGARLAFSIARKSRCGIVRINEASRHRYARRRRNGAHKSHREASAAKSRGTARKCISAGGQRRNLRPRYRRLPGRILRVLGNL